MYCRLILLFAGFLGFISLASAEVLSIGHRGNSLFAPENTIAAVTSALGKADLVEIDGRVTSDGYIVLMHDDTVNRTTDGTGTVSSKTLAEIKLLDAGSWFSSAFIGERVPTLEEMITNTLPAAIPLIEHKSGSAAAYVAELQRLGVTTNVVVQSFTWSFLSDVHALDPTIRLCALGSGTLTATALTNIINTGADTVAWEKGGISTNQVNMVHEKGLKLFVWTVNSVSEIRRFIDLGVDGIITDDPAAVKNLQTPDTNAPPTGYLGDQLVSYWRMDDGISDAFATVVSDSHGTNHGTLVRNDSFSHWLGNSKFGSGLLVAGNTAYVNIPTNLNTSLDTNQVTISAWVRLDQLPSQLPENFGGIFDSVEDSYVFYLDKGNSELRFKVTAANGHAARPGINTAFLETGQWLHIVGTYDGNAFPSAGAAAVYLNGTLMDMHVGNDSAGGTGLTGNIKPGQVTAIGRNGSQAIYPFTGGIDDVAIWRRALSPGEIAKIFQAGQLGQSLADLLIQPDPQLQIVSAGLNVAGTHLEINFHNDGTWQNFQLRRATNFHGPYVPVSNLTPIDLGGGHYRFNYPLDSGNAEFFRVEAY